MSLVPELGLSSLVAHLATFGDRPAVHAGGRTIGYQELAALVEAEARRLSGPRRLVLLEGGNDLDTLVGYLGAHAAGCPVLLSGPGAADGLVAAYDPDLVRSPAGLEIRHGQPAAALHPELALLLSTSGSTGSPKLVRLSRHNVLSNARAIAEYLGITGTDVAATTLPMHYCYGLSVVHSHLLVGAAVLLTDRSVTDPLFWEEARAAGVTTFPGVPHTFELLERLGFTGTELPTLRYLTQAGGKMPAETVRRHALRGRAHGWDLVVMYGATEATARMAWLPPHLAAEAPETIGIPIPGGSFVIEPVPEVPGCDSSDPEVGELVFRGDNVMLGYAHGPADLGLGREVHELRTGDLARQREDGLFEITGRRSRIAKVFGLRLDLDRVERVLREHGVVAAAADGGDALVVAVATGAAPVDAARVLGLVREEFGVAPAGVRLLTPVDLPRLPSGKVDYRTLATTRVQDEAAGTVTPEAVRDLYAELLGRPDATTGASFRALGGDSLSYVEASLRLERLLGVLPPDWPTRTPAELATLARPARRWRGRTLEGSVLIRALAIVLIVGTHANLFAFSGGAHALLGVLGYNFARFRSQEAGLPAVRAVARSAARIAVPAMLVIWLVSLWHPELGWRQILLLNGVLGTDTWYEPQWKYWFVEEALALALFSGLLLAVPVFNGLARRTPFGFALGMVAVGLYFRLMCRVDVGMPGGYEVHQHEGLMRLIGDGDFIHRAHTGLFLFALGWGAAVARGWTQRMVLSALVVVSVPGYFFELPGGAGTAPQRELMVMVGMLALVWVARVRVPALVARVAAALAGASLWIYLVHWEIYPHLELRSPVLATGLSLLAGVLCWLLWTRLEALAARGTWWAAHRRRPVAGNDRASVRVVAGGQA